MALDTCHDGCHDSPGFGTMRRVAPSCSVTPDWLQAIIQAGVVAAVGIVAIVAIVRITRHRND